MTQKFPITILKAPEGTADGTRLAVDFYGDRVRLDTDSFVSEPVPLMVGTVYGYTLFGQTIPSTSPTSANTYIDPTGTYPLQIISKYPFATETDARVTNYTTPTGPTIFGNTGLAGDEKVYSISFSGAQNSPYQNKPGWTIGVGLASGTVDNTFVDPAHVIVGGATGSGTDGYVYGGYYYNDGPFPQPSGYIDTIYKFPFTASISKNDVGELATTGSWFATSGTDDTGFITMGYNTLPTNFATGTIIRTMAYSSDTLATSPYSMYINRAKARGISSPTHGYAVGGGRMAPPYSTFETDMQRYPFAQDAGSSDVGELALAARNSITLSSTEKGYVNGGYTTPAQSSNVDDQYSFPFA